MAIKSIKVDGRTYEISYEILNPNLDDTILFLHGWGADKILMKRAFGVNFNDYRQIYIDLPGFGKSSLDHAINTAQYASIIQHFIAEIKIDPVCVVGHSFGGKVGVLLEPKNLVLLSCAGILLPKKLSTSLKIVIFKFIKLLGFGRFYRLFASKDVSGMNKTMYETFKNVVNEDFSEIFSQFKGRALIFWGKDDKTTPLKSGYKIASLIKNSEFFMLDGDHFFFLLHSKFISNTIRNCLRS